MKTMPNWRRPGTDLGYADFAPSIAREVPSGETVTQDVVVYVVDDDESARDSMRLLLMTVGLEATAFESPVDFIERFDPHRPGCVILDLRMPELNGLETLIQLRDRSKTVPVIFVTGHGDLSTVVRAMKLGAVDFFEKPVSSDLLLESIQHWVAYDIKVHSARRQRAITVARVAALSNRERQVLDCVLSGLSNKETARHLGVGPKVIEIHRSNLMRKMEVHTLVKLVVRVLGSYRIVSQKSPFAPSLDRIDQL